MIEKCLCDIEDALASWGVQRLAELLYANLLILSRKVQRRVQICAEVSENLTGPIMLKSLIFSKHIVVAEN